MKIRITLTERMLGTKSANMDLFTDYIASKAPDGDAKKEELETAKHKEEAGTTIFHRDADGEIIIWNYQIKGFLKEAGDAIRQCSTSEVGPTGKGKKWGSLKAKVDNFVFVYPRQIKLGTKEPAEWCERPLRVMTMQGPRVSVAKSEVIASGTSFEVEINILKGAPITEKMIEQILDYGQLKGLGQWRNAGNGSFTWEKLD